MNYKKKLIEISLPLDAINKASTHEKMPCIGPHPRGLHLWWARRPLAAARAVIFAQMVDDPSAHPDLFPTDHPRAKELFGRHKLEVIAHLSGLIGAAVTVTLEVEADIPAGAPDHVVRTVTENCRTLKFTAQGFEKE